MAKYGEHVESGTDSGHPIVRVADYELFDYISDYLTQDRDLDYDYVTEPNTNCYVMHFASKISLTAIDDALSRLSAEELHRIFRINNS